MSVLFVMVARGVSGVAKDLAKTSAKSAVRILAPAAQGALFRWVATLTGSKNAVKGFGFLLGAVLLATLGFHAAALAMAAVLALIFAGVAVFMPPGLPRGDRKAKFIEVLSRSRDINRLSAARLFLFGARDGWFVVGVPIYFHAVVSDGIPEGIGPRSSWSAASWPCGSWGTAWFRRRLRGFSVRGRGVWATQSPWSGSGRVPLRWFRQRSPGLPS